MGNVLNMGQKNATRWLAFVLVVWLISATSATGLYAQEQVPTTGTVEIEEPGFFTLLITHNSRAILETLKRPEFTLTAFILLNLIIFVETGLLIGFFLPGDSLLVTAGVACYTAGWNLPLLLTTLCISAIVGDSVGYSIGLKTGPKIFNREKSWFFNKDHLLKAHAFYEKHGGKTIILARFMPIVRTFAPVVAGVGKMSYRKFVSFNIIGGVSWVVSMVLIGVSLPMFLNEAFRTWLGNPAFDVQDHIEKVVFLVVFLSIAPGFYVGLKSFWKKKETPAAPPMPLPELMEAK
jgi:membrane-associated protein